MYGGELSEENPSGWKLEVFGTKGTIIMENDKDLKISKGRGYEELRIEDLEAPCQLSSPASQYFNGFYQMVDLIYKSIENEKLHKEVPTFSDGHQVQLVLDAVYQSSLNKTKIEING